jgi:hypothetical protein
MPTNAYSHAASIELRLGIGEGMEIVRVKLGRQKFQALFFVWPGPAEATLKDRDCFVLKI